MGAFVYCIIFFIFDLGLCKMDLSHHSFVDISGWPHSGTRLDDLLLIPNNGDIYLVLFTKYSNTRLSFLLFSIYVINIIMNVNVLILRQVLVSV